MAARKRARKVKTIPRGTPVTWHYRGAIGHGTVAGIASKGTTSATTRYKVREHDHHKGEKPVVIHTGRALHRGSKKK